MKIYAPNKDYCGVSATVGFINGVGETDDPDLIVWFKEHGYKVGKSKKTGNDITSKISNPEDNFNETNKTSENQDGKSETTLEGK